MKKSEEVYNWLRMVIDQNKFSDNLKIPSENFICRKFKVSRTTVRESLQSLIQEGLIYTVRGSGTYINRATVAPMDMGTASKVKIGAILQGQDTGAINGFLEGLHSVIDEKDASLHIYFTDNNFSNERFCLETVANQGFAGFVVDGVKSAILNPNLDCYQQFLDRKIPLVFYNNYYPALSCPRITIDNRGCAEQLISPLITAGHRHIVSVFWCDNQQSLEKFNGYTKTLQRHGLSFKDEEVFWCLSHQARGERFEKDLLKFLKTQPKCTAIVCCNYMVYNTVKAILSRSGKTIPQHYSVVCFDYSENDWAEEGVTCSVHPGFEMGQAAASSLLTMIARKEYKGAQYSQVIPPNIHLGTSIGNLK